MKIRLNYLYANYIDEKYHRNSKGYSQGHLSRRFVYHLLTDVECVLLPIFDM